jgi:hypothetical protein
MSANIIGMDDYFPDGYPDALGIDGNAIYEEVRKALEVSGALPRTGPGVNALGVEDLSGTLKSAEIREKQLNLWKSLPKDKAYGMVAEGSRLDDLGDYGATGFIGGNDAGITTDPAFKRWTREIKYMAVKGQVTLPAQLITAVGFNGKGVNIMETSETLKMLELLRHVERNLWYGNSALDASQWDGLFKQIDAEATVNNRVRLDMRGGIPDKDMLEQLAQIASNNNSDLTDIFGPNEWLRDLRQSLFPEQRLGENYREGSVGAAFNRFLIEALGGDPETMNIKRNHMLTRGVKGGIPRIVPTDASPNAPTAPNSVTGSAGAWTKTLYQPGLVADTYYYSVTAVGKGGRTLSTSVAAGIAATAGQAITLSITDTDPNVQFYEIFRNQAGVDGSVVNNRYFMDRVGRSGNVTTYVDNGYALPDCYDAAALSIGFEEIMFKQLLPVVKRPLPQDLMANSYGILLFGTPVVVVPTHNVHIANIGKRTQAGVGSV